MSDKPPSADPAVIIQRMLARRESTVQLAPGKRMRVRRPAEKDMPRIGRSVEVDDFAACVVGWDGITEADLLGADMASDAPVAYAPELAREVLGDNLEWAGLVAEEVRRAISAHLGKKADVEKN